MTLSTSDQIHKELQSLGPEIIKILQDIDRTATPLEIWQSISKSEKKRFMEMATAKNSAVWELVAATWASDAIFSSAKSLSASYEVALPAKTTLLLSDYVEDYFTEHGLEFVKNTTKTDVSKLKAWVWGQSRYADASLLEQPNLNYIVDGGYARATRIKAIEMHRAAMRGGQGFMGDAGFSVNTWVTRGDSRVRPAHRGNAGVVVEVGKPFPNGEKFPGESSIGCRCHLEYDNDKSTITKNASKVYKENLDNALAEAKAEKAASKSAPTEPVTLLMKGGKVSATPKESIARKIAEKIEVRKVVQFEPSKTIADAKAFAEKHGVKLDVSSDDHLTIANYANGWIADSKNAKLPLPERILVDKKYFLDDVGNIKKHVPANSMPELGSIRLNPESDFFKSDPFKMGVDLQNKRWLESSNVLDHEIGHIQHYTENPEKYGYLLDNKVALPDFAKSHISRYGQSNAIEFVPEMYAGMCGGRTYPDALMQLYKEYGGPKV